VGCCRGNIIIARYRHFLASFLLSVTALAASSGQAQWQPHQIKVGDGQGGQVLVPAQIQSPKFPGSDTTLPFGLVEMDNGEVAMSVGVKTGATTFSGMAFSADQGATWPEWQSMPASENLLTYLGGIKLSTAGITIQSFSFDYGRTWPVQVGNQLANDGLTFITEGNEAVDYDANGNQSKITSVGFHYEPGHGVWPGGDATGFVRSSTNGGVDWQNEVAPPQWKFDAEFGGTTYTRGVSEGSIVRAANGDLVAALRTDMLPEYFLPGPFNDHVEGLAISISKDDGQTWSEMNHLYSAGRHHSHLNRLPNGALVLTMINRLDIRTGLLPDTDQVGFDALVSFDNGLTWDVNRRVTLHEITNPLSFPNTVVGHTGAAALGDGSMLAAYGQSADIGGTPVLVKWDPSTAFGPALELHVNRLNGSTQIVGVGGSTNLDSYTIASASTTASDVWLPANWNSITDQDGGTWEEVPVGGSTTQLMEQNLSGSKPVLSGGAISLGNIYDTADTEEDIRFTYGLAGNANPLVGLVVFTTPATVFTWNQSGLEDWANPDNWSKEASLGLPPGNLRANNADHTAIFPDDANITGTTNVSTNAAVTLNRIEFNNPTHSFVVSGAGSVTLSEDSTGASPTVVVEDHHEFQADVILQNNTQLDVAFASSLAFNNRLDVGANTLTKIGAGTLAINNVLNANGGEISCTTGTCNGSGTVVGNLNNPSGTVAPGNSPGILTVDGNYTQGGSGTLALEIGGLVPGEDHDKLVVSGIATLDGTLDVTLINGFTLAGDMLFDVLDVDSVVNDFSTFNLPAGLVWNVSDGSLCFGTCTGGGLTDYDNDGSWGLGDLNLVLFNWNIDGEVLKTDWINQRPVTGTPVGLAKLNGVLFNWGNFSSMATVPEPAAGMLAVSGLLAFGIRRRNK